MQVEISIGELFDKLTILEIKIDKINDPAKLENVTKEWNALNEKSMDILSIFADSVLFKKIDQLKRQVSYQIAKTDWYITRKIERDINIPSEVTTERNNIFSECETKEAEINALTNKADVITYEIVFNYESNE